MTARSDGGVHSTLLLQAPMQSTEHQFFATPHAVLQMPNESLVYIHALALLHHCTLFALTACNLDVGKYG